MGQTIGSSWAKSESQHTLAEVRFAPKAALSGLEIQLPLDPRKQTQLAVRGTSEKCHVWTAPGWQELFSHFAALVGAAMCSAF
jgi:hypothetical protein